MHCRPQSAQYATLLQCSFQSSHTHMNYQLSISFIDTMGYFNTLILRQEQSLCNDLPTSSAFKMKVVLENPQTFLFLRIVIQNGIQEEKICNLSRVR